MSYEHPGPNCLGDVHVYEYEDAPYFSDDEVWFVGIGLDSIGGMAFATFDPDDARDIAKEILEMADYIDEKRAKHGR